MAKRPKRYTVSDGKLVLRLEEAEEGGFIVTSPLDPGLVTEAETISEAFVMARDAMRALARGRAKPFNQRSPRGGAIGKGEFRRVRLRGRGHEV